MAPLMDEAPPGFDPWAAVDGDEGRPLLLGVIPHTMCNPRVRGCGFCTFPHERFGRARVEALTERVLTELDVTVARRPELSRRRVDAVYFGGGTANLTPARQLGRLGERVARGFEIGAAEHTLEGAPVYFGARDGEALGTLASALGSRRLRISMGIQTFDEARLSQMGRLHLGRREHVRRALRVAHRLGATTSGDLLINQPGQSLAQMLDDIDEAITLGLDQICVYHLVLFARLGTQWSRDPGLMAQLPSNERAFAHWAAVRSELLARGYVQRTLTNFERATVPAGRRFVYEEHSFHPETYDAVGFGPAGISTFGEALKWCNADTGDEYVARMDRDRRAAARSFSYGDVDRRLLYLTRKLPLLQVWRAGYREHFGTELLADFGEILAVLQRAGLLEIEPERVALTARGMFFADTVAGLLAWRRTRELRHDLPEHAGKAHMMG